MKTFVFAPKWYEMGWVVVAKDKKEALATLIYAFHEGIKEEREGLSEAEGFDWPTLNEINLGKWAGVDVDDPETYPNGYEIYELEPGKVFGFEDS